MGTRKRPGPSKTPALFIRLLRKGVPKGRRCRPSFIYALWAPGPADLHAWVSEHVPTDAEAIVIGGNGFRAVGVIAVLEEDLGRPVVTANQALLWAALRAADADSSSVSDYGRLFEHG